MKWYSEHGVDGILTQFHISHWTAYGMNYVLMARAARSEDQEAAVSDLFNERFGDDAEKGRSLYRKIKNLMMKFDGCHISYPYSLLSRTSVAKYEEILQDARQLAALKKQDVFRQELLIWIEYLLRFQKLFDAYHAKRLTENELDGFLAWIHSYAGTHIFVQEKFDLYFEALREDLRSGKPWLHFNLDWEDDYIRRQEKTIYHLHGSRHFRNCQCGSEAGS